MNVNNIYNYDCLKDCKLIPKGIVDLVVTSPPYANMVSYGNKVNVKKPSDYPDWILPLFKEAENFLSDTGSFILNINDRVVKGERATYSMRTVINILDNTNLKLYDRYIWYKQNGLPSTGNKRLNDRVEYIYHFVKDTKKFKTNTDLIRIPYSDVSINRFKYDIYGSNTTDDDGKVKRRKKSSAPNPKGTKPTTVFKFQTAGVLRGNKHPAPFHPELPEFFIKWLTDEGDLVFDPFAGSGTTLIKAKEMNRKYLGFEINKVYIDTIIKPRIDNCVNTKCKKE